ncbi:Hypothetical predicted protein [Mytilus galloprovincialis]|uniref:Uncharacterized protein n=1 Tax=Mytilus galloprovincialis TaxID=29158 RepID=A0A8B6D2J2_MYTGA|nr:Hypothetical predicted protein [Mytilus galloprovincialis]
MDDIEERVNIEKLDNFISVCLGLKYIMIGLQDLVIDKLKLKHMEIQQKCTIGNCHQNCSRKFGKSFIKWCGTCKYWKLELHRFIRYSSHWDQIQWNKIDSINFPQSIEEIAKIFVKNFHSVGDGVFGDFSALMSLISNTTLFNISSTEINEILRIRHSYFTHNYSAELNEQEKKFCFIVFKRFLNNLEMNCTKSGKNLLHCIEALRSSQGLPNHILLKPEGRRALSSVREDVHYDNIDRNIIYSNTNRNIRYSNRDRINIYSNRKLEERLQQITDLLNKSGRYYIYFGPLSKTMRMILIQLYFIISLFYLYLSVPSTKEKPKGTAGTYYYILNVITSVFLIKLRPMGTSNRDFLKKKF